ncbi:DUF1192 domain-containing protein [Falsiroseomonas selenitidurans]|uniref:DUF1192 domain-containing protein n=1 Tax=Falsiroseomonas selenitidurans TaxID=2716335 RepID=A0ABX1E5M1_9PROT|nr:DUF1192 domain-containing protein [Falsiroseomonas selenitidurans]NKC32489.1 DUF1192 domain-containing protein [Falsiroseomonas selenitidurans]
MSLEEDLPRRSAAFQPPVIDRWDVEELRAYIARLQAEIARAEAEIGKRQAHRSAADAFFRRPGG